MSLLLALAGAEPVASPAEPVFSGGWLHAYEVVRSQQYRRKREQQERERESDEIADTTSREIAKLLREQEALDAKRDDLARLQTLADRYAKAPQDLPAQISDTLQKAFEQRTRNALEQLAREMERMFEEEEIAVLLMILNAD